VKNTMIALAAAALLAACGAKTEATNASGNSPAAAPAGANVTQQVPPAAQPAAAQPSTSASPAPAAAGLLSGKVLETFNSGGYTYVRLETPTGEQWAAVNESKVKKGDTVSVAAQMTMENFKSNSLNRTFDRIVFGTLATPGAAPAVAPATGMQAKMPPGHPSAGGGAMPAAMASAMGSPSQHMAAPDAGDVKVPKADGGKTVAEIWAGKSALNGKEVVVRGKVVKFLAGIMGRNWMHIQDGTGADGTSDLTVTTDATASVGDVVTVKGTLAVDKDFGAGYRYAVIVEKASVSK
jgi:hypothetical protein